MTETRGWTGADVPEQTGTTFVVTGANSGLGLETARVLARRGAHVIMAVRDRSRGEAAAEDIRAGVPHARLTVGDLDLADLSSIRAFAAWIEVEDHPVHVLINNAGVMMVPRGRTAEGFETHFGINHLGHFALTGLLIERMLAHEAPRVVTVTSLAHRRAIIDFHDLDHDANYKPFEAYAQSKLANLLFTMELQRRFRRAGRRDGRSLAAHPGLSDTDLWHASEGSAWAKAQPLFERVAPLVTQSAAEGAWPVLRAATQPRVTGGDVFGPDGRLQIAGKAVKVKAKPKAYDVHDARGLWEASVDRTGVDFAALAPADAATVLADIADHGTGAPD